VALSHPPHPSSLATGSSAAINIPHSYYSTRGAGGGSFSGPLTTGSMTGPQMPSLIPHNQMIYNPIISASGSGNPSSHARTSSGSRQRSGTLDQMDVVPPQLQKVQVDLANYSGQSVTPVLRRDDQYLAWEARQQQGIGAPNSTGIPGNSGLSRRASYRANPQLEYLHEQAESSDAWGSGHRGQVRYAHYQPSVNPSTHYMSTGTVPIPASAGMMTQQPPGHPQTVGQQPPKSSSSSFSVVVDDDYPSMRQESHSRPSGSTRTAEHDIVPLDDYDHRDGGQAMAYLPIIPKPSSASNTRNNSAGLNNIAPGSSAVRIDDPGHHHSQHLSSLGRLMNS